MSTPNSNEKSISNLKGDAVNGDGILGGGKSAPVVIAPSFDDMPVDLNMPQVVITPDQRADYMDDGSVMAVEGPNAIS